MQNLNGQLTDGNDRIKGDIDDTLDKKAGFDSLSPPRVAKTALGY